MGLPRITYNGVNIDFINDIDELDPQYPDLNPKNTAVSGKQETLIARADVIVRVGQSMELDEDLKRKIRNWFSWAKRGLPWTIARDRDEVVLVQLAVAASAGATTIELTDATDVIVGKQYVLRTTTLLQVVKIASVSAPNVTIAEPLDFDFPAGSRFRSELFWPGRLLNNANPIIPGRVLYSIVLDFKEDVNELSLALPAAPEAATIDAMFAYTSPRGDPSTAYAARCFFILDVTNQILYKAILSAGDWSIWSEETIPSGDWIELASNYSGGCVAFGSDARIMTKYLPLSGDDTDYPWTAYDVALPLHGGVDDTAPEDFWSGAYGSTLPAAAIDSSGVIQSGLSSGSGEKLDVWGAVTNTLPAGTWNRLYGEGVDGQTAGLDNCLVIGDGAVVLRYYEGWGDTDWFELACPSGNWTSLARCGSSAYSAFMVGVGAGMAAQSASDFLETELVSFTMPTGWTGIVPHVAYSGEMYVVGGGNGNDGTYVVVGGEIDGESVVVCVPIRDDGETLLTPIISTLPGGIPAGTKWQKVIVNTAGGSGGTGILIVGTNGTDISILSNDLGATGGTPDTYDNWVLKTLAEAPL